MFMRDMVRGGVASFPRFFLFGENLDLKFELRS